MKENNTKVLSALRVILGYVGFNMILVGAAVLLTLLALIPYPEEVIYAQYFIITAVPSILIGMYLFLPVYKKEKVELSKNHDYIIVFLSWIVAIIICSFPYFLIGCSFTESIFESTSGLTTAGFSIMDVDSLPNIFLLFRSITLYVGGIGIILIMTSLFATSFGMRLYSAEGHTNKLIPNVIKSARMIVCMYTGYILIGIILYIMFGMSAFDAINHSIAAVANGGFSIRSANIGYYDSFAIEIITMVLMILGGTNFLLILMFMKGNFKAFFKHCETKITLLLWIIFVPILSFALLGGVCSTIGDSFRVALFHIVSAMTTAGFQTIKSFENWPSAGLLILSILMSIGFQAGSTTAGIKEYRIAIILKSIYYDLKSKLMHKREVMSRKINIYGEEEKLTDERTSDAHNFTMLYVGTIMVGTLIYTLCGYSIEESLFEFSSILSCVGFSVGITGAGASNFVNWVAIVGMIIGRLDIYLTLLVGLVTAKDVKNGIKKCIEKERK